MILTNFRLHSMETGELSMSALEVETQPIQVDPLSSETPKSSSDSGLVSQRVIMDSQPVKKTKNSLKTLSSDGLSALNEAVEGLKHDSVVATPTASPVDSTSSNGDGIAIVQSFIPVDDKDSTRNVAGRVAVNNPRVEPEMECFQLSGTPATRGSESSQQEAQDSLANMPLSATPQLLGAPKSKLGPSNEYAGDAVDKATRGNALNMKRSTSVREDSGDPTNDADGDATDDDEDKGI